MTTLTDDQVIFASPKRGVSISTATKGVETFRHYTFMCDARDDCWAVGYGSTEGYAREMVKGHSCPMPMRRDTMPSGKTIIQKLWDELDDVIDKIKAYDNDSAEPIGFAEDRGYALGLAMSLAFMSIPFFRTQTDILRQAERRYKMRTNQIPWESTPGYNFMPAGPLLQAFHANEAAKAEPTKPAPAKAAPRKAAPLKPAEKVLSASDIDTLRIAIENGIERTVLADVYGVSLAEVNRLVPKPSSATDDSLDLELF